MAKIDTRRLIDSDLDDVSGGVYIIRDNKLSNDEYKYNVIREGLNDSSSSRPQDRQDDRKTDVNAKRFNSEMFGNEVMVGKDISDKNKKDNFFTRLFRAIFK